jgi:hypothetical protein
LGVLLIALSVGFVPARLTCASQWPPDASRFTIVDIADPFSIACVRSAIVHGNIQPVNPMDAKVRFRCLLSTVLNML